MKSPIPIKPICCCIRSTGNRAGSFLADMNGPGKESMKWKYKIAMVQMDTQNNKEKNLEDACAWIDEAAASGAELVCFPEVMNLIGKNTGPGGGREPIPGYSTGRLMEKAAEHGIYIHGGSITEEIPGEKRACNTSVLIGPDGGILARYRKLHTFDITLADGRPFRESDRIRPGDTVVTAETELGCFGMSICYDVRFPELYRLLAIKGAKVFFVPVSFTKETGEEHLELLLRARAVENGCYVIAAAQTGVKPAYTAYGNSMLIDPWGKVLVRAGSETGVFYGEIDLDHADAVRRRMPSLESRRTDVYQVEEKRK